MSLVDTLLKLISIESETGKEEKILDFINQFLIENNFKGEILRSSGGIVAVPTRVFNVPGGTKAVYSHPPCLVGGGCVYWPGSVLITRQGNKKLPKKPQKP